VHSCADELSDLFDRAALGKDDRVCFTGDLLSRGPKPHDVLRLFRSVGARSAVGNHEQRLLEAQRARQSGERGPRLSPSHQAIVQELSDDDWRLLESLPLLLEVPEHGVVVAHAGIDPSRALAEQDPWVVTHIRSLTADGKPSDRWGIPWASRYQHPPHIVFGHNARKSPQLHAFATGLDTGCVYGGALTALILPEGAAPPSVSERRDALLSVPARFEYADYGRTLSD
jgi:diadenosine tetraphosphatase ApaH/serine/threonine PP2A family protein phosphatase